MGVTTKLLKGISHSKGLHIGCLDGYERLIAGIYGTPDRVPVILQPYTYAMSSNKLTAREFFSEARPFINASSNTARYLGVDFWSPVFDFYNIELEAMGGTLIWRDGSEPDVDTRKPLITGEEDLARLKAPVPGVSGRMPYVLESYRRYMKIMGLPPMAYCCSPFTLAVLARGYVGFIRDMRRNKKFAHALMEFLSMEVVVPWIDRMVEVTKTAIVVMSDAWASAPNMTTDMVEEFCLPYVEKVIKATNSPMRTVMDSGSWGEKELPDPEKILDIKMQMMTRGNAFPALRPFFLLVWNEDYEVVGVPRVRAYAERRKVCLMLNVRPDLIEAGPPEKIAANVARLLREGAGDGRFVLLINLVPVGAPVENALAAVAAVKQFGSYPLGEMDVSSFKLPDKVPYDQWVVRDGLPVH